LAVYSVMKGVGKVVGLRHFEKEKESVGGKRVEQGGRRRVGRVAV
jgi:hypothetical protein